MLGGFYVSNSYYSTGGGGGASTFTELTDTPTSYTDHGEKIVKVKADESGLEFAEVSIIGSSTEELSFSWVIDSPATGYIPGLRLWRSVYWKRIDAYVVDLTSVTFNIEQRVSPDTTTGDYILATNLVADQDGVSSTNFVDTSSAEGTYLFVHITGMSGAPSTLVVQLVYEVPARMLSGNLEVFDSYTWSIVDPQVMGYPGPRVEDDITLLRVDGFCIGSTSTTSFNIESRVSPDSTGADLLISELTVTPSGGSLTDFSASTVSGGSWLWLDVSQVTASPTRLGVTLKYKKPIHY